MTGWSGGTVHRCPSRGSRLGVNRGTHTASTVASFGAFCGNAHAVASTKPRFVMVCAPADGGTDPARSRVRSSRGSSSTALLAADRLQREVFILERHVVLQFLQRQPCPAASAEIDHLELPGAPDALNVLDVGVVQAAGQPI